jgi:hypothetical protein
LSTDTYYTEPFWFGEALVTVVIKVEKVPKKLLTPYADTTEPVGIVPEGLTLFPKKRGGYQQIEVLICEKMSQYRTRLAIAHELFHCYQYLTDCLDDETNTYLVSEVMVKALVEKRKGRRS